MPNSPRILFLCLSVIVSLPPCVVGYHTRWSLQATKLHTRRSPIQLAVKAIGGGDTRDEEGFDFYSRDLQKQITLESTEYPVIDDDVGSKAKRWMKIPFQWIGRRLSKPPKPGKLILLRCGQSEWNANGTFTGWADPDLTQQGIQECQHAARLLLAEGYEPDLVYTSRLKRSIKSAAYVLSELGTLFLPLQKSWRLNERCYGALTGLSKKETAKAMGASVVQAWRNSLKARPPPHSKEDPYYPGNDRRYADLRDDQIPLSESLLDTMKRTIPLWEYKIKRDIANGNNVLVVGHGNTLRGLLKVIDDVSDVEIQEVNLPRGIPVVYSFDKNLRPQPAGKKMSQLNTNAIFLEKPGLLQEALKQQDKWREMVPGLDEDQIRPQVARDQTLVDALQQLRAEQRAEIAITGVDDMSTQSPLGYERWDDDPSEFEDWDEFSGDEFEDRLSPFLSWTPASVSPVSENKRPALKESDPVVVFIRHGRTAHNNLGLFTGWEDPPLAPDGIEDAKRAGRILKQHGFQFDVLYTSWLARAIETGLYVLDELDCPWIPVIKSWRLNERNYGALTGKSKAMIANEYGEEQLKRWRRGFKIRPPPVSSYSLNYPGNDFRRIKYVKDLRVSWTETINRSIEQRKFQLHRKFPKTESLHDCMKRSIPFYTERITKEAIHRGKRVLITSHENALRGILMHLCGIPEEAMNQLHIPNGVPLVYNLKANCITLLEDNESDTQISIEDFGPAAKYLFRPCELDDEFFEESTVERTEASQQVVKNPVSDAPPRINIEEDMEIIVSRDTDSSTTPPMDGTSFSELSP
ncbi:phosphoglyceromutase [Nitzschia inconspicua]|uniref:phosphoglycerate mutase (2,3-diphosphoglycerate-dependent) n=1 Tax=Nitzschia inconspicua TaxID=303405 RepID=A0A9K3KGY2_9STRA|nr:phosphoglyceromutase [Nitzschia inconspicua]